MRLTPLLTILKQTQNKILLTFKISINFMKTAIWLVNKLQSSQNIEF